MIIKIFLFFLFLFIAESDVYAFQYPDMIIGVDFKTLSLTLRDENGKIIETFSVALPRGKTELPIKGYVKNVQLNPTWRPTKGTRESYLRAKKIELPASILPGSPLNAMGVGVINIVFESNKINPLIKIHGTNDPKSIGKRITRGCIRLKNENIRSLINAIKGKKVIVLFK